MYLPSYDLIFNPLRRGFLGTPFDDHIGFADNPSDTTKSWLSPPIDIKEYDNKWSILVDLPGVSVDAVNVDVDDSQLTVEAHNRKETKNEKGNDFYTERYEGTYKRSFRLPESADTDKITAKMVNGVLHITVEKKEVVDSKKRIKIELK